MLQNELQVLTNRFGLIWVEFRRFWVPFSAQMVADNMVQGGATAAQWLGASPLRRSGYWLFGFELAHCGAVSLAWLTAAQWFVAEVRVRVDFQTLITFDP